MDIPFCGKFCVADWKNARSRSLLIGGHSVEDNEIKYGLSVTGVVHPDKVLFNQGTRAGDKLIFDKASWNGHYQHGNKSSEASNNQIKQVINSMS